MKNKLLIFIFVLLCSNLLLAQKTTQAKDTTGVETVQIDEVTIKNIQTQKTWNTDPLSPARAAFYSAVLPGLGQIYNKSYWKAPIVWGAIGTGGYFYVRNSKEYNRYQTAYKSRLAGKKDDEFWGDRADGQPRLSTDGLQRAIKFYQRNKEMSVLVTVGLYVLNIIEANVDAHLKQFNVDEKLSIEPYLKNEEITSYPEYGLALRLKF